MMSVMTVHVLALLAVSLGLAPQKPPQNALTPVKEVSCSFPLFAVAQYPNGVPLAVVRTQEFTFHIDAIDLKKGAARIVGNVGSAPATVVLTATGLNVFERTTLGNFNITTIFLAGAKEKTYLAVHSRHIGEADATPTVTQNYGTCDVVR
jgi:hypothetical protein